MDIVISSQVTPTFTQIGPLCLNSSAPSLPGTSDNGFAGNWNPSTINTSAIGTITYTFTPSDPCAAITTMDIVINSQIVPTFLQIGPFCLNSTAPLLPGTSDNGFAGNWSPSTINTSATGTITYTFTPIDPCATSTTMDILIANQVTPTFTQIAPLCLNSVAPLLPGTSINGFAGNWNPSTINTSAVGMITYTFTPADPCATATSMDIIVNPLVTPVFAQIGPLCQNGTVPVLPLSSINGVTGRWVPDVVTLASSGSYTFTPDPGQCAQPYTMNILVNIAPKAVLSGDGTICSGLSKTLDVAFTGNGPFGFTYSDGINIFNINSINTPSYQFVVKPGLTTTYTITNTTDAACTNAGDRSAATVTVLAPIRSVRYPTVIADANTPIQLNAQDFGAGSTYTWNPPAGLSDASVANPTFNYDQQIEYTIDITTPGGCSVTDTLLVKLKIEAPATSNSNLFVPKAWTPNGDGHNDKLFPLTSNVRELKYFRIFNRWGQLVFETNTIGFGWDGSFRGQPQSSEVYTWIAEAVGVDGKIFSRSGNSVLLR